MGLDMYLYKKDQNGDSVEVAYWRKANQIRGWLESHGIIDYDDNCVDREIEPEKIEELIQDCVKVLSHHELAPEIMPVSAGFFFGSTEYGDWYFEDLERTVEMLTEGLESYEDGDVFVYSDSW